MATFLITFLVLFNGRNYQKLQEAVRRHEPRLWSEMTDHASAFAEWKKQRRIVVFLKRKEDKGMALEIQKVADRTRFYSRVDHRSMMCMFAIGFLIFWDAWPLWKLAD